MSSLRQDPLTGRWVIVAAKRQGRPNDFKNDQGRNAEQSQHLNIRKDCDFCPGQESSTPAEVMAVGRPECQPPNSPGWRVRVFPNKYPAMLPKADDEREPQASSSFPTDDSLLCPEGEASGGHEVLVCGPGHFDGLELLSTNHLTELLSVIAQRTSALAQEHPNARYVLTFGNQGPEAGATLAHPHLQIITTPVVPALVVDKVANFIRHQKEVQSCLVCDMLKSEEAHGVRLVAANSDWVAVTPWASRFAYEMKLIPRKHRGSLLEASNSEIRNLALLLKHCLTRLNACAANVDFNLIIHNAPVALRSGCGYGNERLDSLLDEAESQKELFHWHVEILPRLSRLAGFETGTGFAINSLPPEDAAARLRLEGS